MEATQDDTCEDYEEEEEVEKVWGRLIPNNPKWGIHELAKSSYIIGRDKESDIVISNCKVISGKHCKIFRDTSVVFIEDLSTNGTFINSDPKLGKNKKRILSSGGKITVSKFNSKFQTEEISFIFMDVKDDCQEQEKGGPFQKYHVADILGSGAFATVKLAINKETNEKVALKVISKKKCCTPDKKSALQDEVKILQRLDHPGVIRIIECFDTESNLYLALELVTGGELFDLVSDRGVLSEDESRPLLTQMLEAICYLHENGIAHRDLKLENILLTDKKRDTIKISDFGLSRIIGDGNFMKTICGTPEYLAPEVLSNKFGGYSKAVDMWSLGVILYTMVFGMRPFEAVGGAAIFDRVAAGTYEFPSDKIVSPEVKDLIEKMLTVDSQKRITAFQALHHPWITGIKNQEESVLPPPKRVNKVKQTTPAANSNTRSRNTQSNNNNNNNNNNNSNGNWKKRSHEEMDNNETDLSSNKKVKLKK